VRCLGKKKRISCYKFLDSNDIGDVGRAREEEIQEGDINDDSLMKLAELMEGR